jgi:ABC-type transporter Mla subunit MlaD
LDVTSTTLDSAALALDGLHATAVDVSQTLSTTQMTIDEMAQLTQDDLPQSIESSLTALDTLEETAELIDQLLRSLNQFGVGNYDPQVPLDRAVAMASQELNTIPDGLRAMAVGLTRTNANLKGVQDGVLSMADHIVNINGNVSDADEIVATHRETMRRFREQLETLRRNLDRSVRVVAWGLTLLLIWVGLSQLAIVQWGLGLWRRPPSETKVRSGDRANGAQ